MEKEETQKPEYEKLDESKAPEINEKNEEVKKELTPEEKIKELEDKLTRYLAEMEVALAFYGSVPDLSASLFVPLRSVPPGIS